MAAGVESLLIAEPPDHAKAPSAEGPAAERPAAARPGEAGGPERNAATRARIDRLIAAIDRLLTAQVDAILHDPRFQRLEATWRGVAWLIAVAEGTRRFELRILTISWAAIVRDFERAVEFDQSNLFNKIYTEGLDTPGADPLSLIVADYEPSTHPRDVTTLRELSAVAAAAFAPMILGCAPSVFELESFARIGPHLDFTTMFNKLEFRGWQSLRKHEDSRFLAIVVPRILMRLPYLPDGSRADGFVYREATAAPDGTDWLWGCAAYAFAAVAIRSYASYGWLADLRGVHSDGTGGGLVDRLPAPFYPTDREGIAMRNPVEVALAEHHEREFADLGFIPIVPARLTPYLVFHSNQSLHLPPRYDTAIARANAKLSSMMQQVLCASRFAHHLKAMVRDKVGSFISAEDCERYLSKWINGYCMANDDASEDVKATYPLREARVEVKEIAGKPGHYACTAHLQPQFQLDEMNAVFRLVTVVQAQRAA